jgi:2-iminobutanoate/2-iminopropanoate deaminase
MPRKIVATDKAPKAIGPYSQGNILECKQLVFVSGQIAIDPATGIMSQGNITEQTHQVLKNVAAILEAAGSGLDKVVKTTVYLKNFDDFQAMNEVHMHYFSKNFPARATCEVARLPKDALVEIEAIGYIE